MDQAQNLRKYINLSHLSGKMTDSDKNAKIITISSGKGGVGKTNFSVNLAIALAKLGRRVTLIDADLGLANVDVIMDLVPKYNLNHVIRLEKTIEEIIVDGPYGLKIISGGSGLVEMANLTKDKLKRLIESFELLNEKSDYILIDTGAGLGDSVISFVEAAHDVILIVTPDPTSITDAYALIKNIHKMEKNLRIVVNRVDSNKEGYEVFNKIHLAVKRFLDSEIEHLGFIYEDSSVKKSIMSQTPLLVAFPNSLASKGIEMIANSIDNSGVFEPAPNTFRNFINKLFANV